MKIILNCLVWVLAFTGKSCQQEQQPEMLTYERSSRGFQTELRVTRDSIHLVRKGVDPLSRSLALPVSEWKTLQDLVGETTNRDYNEEGGTEGMASDRSPGVMIKIHYKDKVRATPTWSADAAPEALKPLNLKFQELLKWVESQG